MANWFSGVQARQGLRLLYQRKLCQSYPEAASLPLAEICQSYTLGEVSNTTAEVSYPDLATNSPPGGLSTSFNGIPFGSSSNSTFISVQALYVTPDDTLWVLDTGRPSTNETQMVTMPYAQPGGPKLIAMNLTSNSISRTYTFPLNVHYPDSYSKYILTLYSERWSFGGYGSPKLLFVPWMREEYLHLNSSIALCVLIRSNLLQ